jgi:transposase
MVTYKGRWQITVIGKDSSWDQRVAITGQSSGPPYIPGVIGNSQVIDGGDWNLTIQHNAGSGWAENEGVLPDPMQEIGAAMSQVVRSKDHYTPGDTDPNDLVVKVDKMGPMFELTVRPYAIDAQTLVMFADGVFVGVNGLQLMGVEVRNSWGETFTDERLLEISDLGRATLASFGINVVDSWSPQVLAATQQVVVGRAVRIPALAVGEKATVYFQVDARGARRGKPEVEFVLRNEPTTPDPSHPMRHNARAVFIAEVDYDPATGRVQALVPEGRMTLRLRSLMVDPRALDDLCSDAARAGRRARSDPARYKALIDAVTRSRREPCDQAVLRELLRLLCECLDDACQDGKNGPGGGGWGRVCVPGGMWVPLKFDYTVEVTGGFKGQHGPLPFQDPWWKVLLLIIAVIAWLVGLIFSIIADVSGWGNTGDHPRKIGTVGISNRISTDACIIELDGSRPAIQKVVDVITGEPNNHPIIGLDTVIPIDPQVAFPTLTSAAVVGKQVYKSGSRTGLTHGIITSFAAFTQSRGNDGTPDPNHPDLHFTQPQFYIDADPAFGEEMFDDHGDSGSLVLSREAGSMNQVVGLLHSGAGGTSPIQDVLQALGLKLR